MSQLIRNGIVDYLSDPWNYADMVYIYGSIANVFLQFYLGPFHSATRLLLCIIILLLVVKTFFFMRIFPTLTPLVVMLTNVFGDLKPFMLFYTILIVMLGQLYAIIGLANAYHKRGTFSANYLDMLTEAKDKDSVHLIDGMPGKEYYHVGLWVGEIIWALRMSIGDNDAINSSSMLAPTENILFWVCFGITVFSSCVVFLNFIVAEASATYANVTETIDATIWMERSSLINEAEDMTWSKFKD